MKTQICAALLLYLPMGAQQPHKQVDASSLRSPLFLGSIKVRVLPAFSDIINFWLITSWTPGAQGKGVLHYQISGAPIQPVSTEAITAATAASTSATDIIVKKLVRCNFTLELYDENNFVQMEIPLTFMLAENDAAMATAIRANDMAPMDRDSYLGLRKNWTWNVVWSGCPAY